GGECRRSAGAGGGAARRGQDHRAVARERARAGHAGGGAEAPATQPSAGARGAGALAQPVASREDAVIFAPQPPTPSPAGPHAASAGACSRVKCLLVDDVAENLVALEALLQGEEVDILKADSGPAALELLLQHEDVALALLDVQMPEMNG